MHQLYLLVGTHLHSSGTFKLLHVLKPAPLDNHLLLTTAVATVHNNKTISCWVASKSCSAKMADFQRKLQQEGDVMKYEAIQQQVE